MTVGVAVAWCALCRVCSVVAVMILTSLSVLLFGEGSQSQLGILGVGLASAVTYSGATWGVLRVHAPNWRPRRSLALAMGSPAAVLLGFLLGVSLKLPAETLVDVVVSYFPLDSQSQRARDELFATERPSQLLSLVLVGCLVAPIVEELFFRGAIFGQLGTERPWRAGLWTAALFVVAHPEFRQWPALSVLALLLSYVRAKSRVLGPCLALHVGFNSTSVFVMHQLPHVTTKDISTMAIAGAYLVSLVLIVTFHHTSCRVPRTPSSDAELA